MSITLRSNLTRELTHNELDGNFTDLNGRVTTLTADLNAAEATIATLTADLNAAEAKITTLEAQAVDFESRITALEP